MQLDNTPVIVTGGASGMGQATARRLAAKGAKVALLDKNADALNAVAKDIGGLAIPCDVTSDQAIEEGLSFAAEQQGIARVCINCAGIAPSARIVGRSGPMPLDSFSQVIHINLIGTFNVMRVFAAKLYEANPIGESGERGVIINTASVAAYEGQIGQAAYSASKGGIIALTLPAAREFSKFGIRVNVIAPGIMQTPMMAGMSSEIQDSLAATVTFPKRLGHADEFAKLAEHIIVNEYLNGETIRLDGAIRMQAK